LPARCGRRRGLNCDRTAGERESTYGRPGLDGRRARPFRVRSPVALRGLVAAGVRRRAGGRRSVGRSRSRSCRGRRRRPRGRGMCHRRLRRRLRSRLRGLRLRWRYGGRIRVRRGGRRRRFRLRCRVRERRSRTGCREARPEGEAPVAECADDGDRKRPRDAMPLAWCHRSPSDRQPQPVSLRTDSGPA
jgi:hypothetical protein